MDLKGDNLYDTDYHPTRHLDAQQRARLEKYLIEYETPSYDGKYSAKALEDDRVGIRALRKKTNGFKADTQRELDEISEQRQAMDLCQIFVPELASPASVPTSTVPLSLITKPRGDYFAQLFMRQTSGRVPKPVPDPFAQTESSSSTPQQFEAPLPLVCTVHNARRDSTANIPKLSSAEHHHAGVGLDRSYPPKHSSFFMQRALPTSALPGGEPMPVPWSSSQSPFLPSTNLPASSSQIPPLANYSRPQLKRRFDTGRQLGSPSKKRRIEDVSSLRDENIQLPRTVVPEDSVDSL
ncbi:hypothetical protein DL96DRAFT_1629698 [Flagelloscypha sp. PMI_526]|nr:hypothetical protein DL96DRAFT_1629698 [Flagelloscypha sp. PMI_526]